jgi:hypothetical protein
MRSPHLYANPYSILHKEPEEDATVDTQFPLDTKGWLNIIFGT